MEERPEPGEPAGDDANAGRTDTVPGDDGNPDVR
jgi:hypothetical protein